MLAAIETHRTELGTLCRRFHVRRLDLFGSAARGDFDPARSDLDFLVTYESDIPMKALDSYFGFKEALEAMFGRPVDLVMSDAIENPYIRQSIEQSRETIYDA
jgi:predicted nucleotidyltransferase